MTEFLDNTTEVVLQEEQDGKKKYFIEGVFAQADTPNRNKRTYPLKIMEREVQNYQQMITQKRSIGELNHPNVPTVNPERASHLITELRFDGNNVVGKAKILSTPVGKIVESLLSDGVQLGVSTRGLGSLKPLSTGINEVQSDFKLNTIDIVSDPSAPDAFVNGVMENANWVYENGMWVISEKIKDTIKKTNSKELNERKLKLFEFFLHNIK